MKRRIDIFETNSSSSHSISFNPWKSGKDGNNFVPSGDGCIHVTGGEFGWEWESYNDSVTKANYYLEEYRDDQERLKLLEKVIEDYTGFPVVIEHNTEGYIDHQSRGTLYLPEGDPEALKDWLFNPYNWLYTGNDNSDEPDSLRDRELNFIGCENIVLVTMSFGPKVIIDFKIIGMPTEENLGPKLNDLYISDGYYILKEMDLENNHFVLYENWSNSEKTGKIIKIVSNEFGEIVL